MTFPSELIFLPTSLKPRAWLYMEVASDRDEHRPRVDLNESKCEQGPRQMVLEMVSSSGVRL